MSQKKKGHTKRAKQSKASLRVSAVGLSLSLAGVASVEVNAPAAAAPSLQVAPQELALGLSEEEIADISLSSFYAFDKENAGGLRPTFWHMARPSGCCCGSAWKSMSSKQRQRAARNGLC
jgi:hypothetical protein